ncbi:hypothetical protein Droror1_Dr00020038 [Drosera rotundifolia]
MICESMFQYQDLGELAAVSEPVEAVTNGTVRNERRSRRATWWILGDVFEEREQEKENGREKVEIPGSVVWLLLGFVELQQVKDVVSWSSMVASFGSFGSLTCRSMIWRWGFV